MRLVARDLVGERGGIRLFGPLELTLGAGEALIVRGPNGAGKSTLLRVLAGLLPSAEGRVMLDGGGEEWPTAASACHYLGHADGMSRALSVQENLAFWQAFLGGRGLAPGEALAALGLQAIGHLPFGVLSAGQRRRVALARLLLSHRPLWLLDEPAASLDRASSSRLAGLFERHCADGGILVATTHQSLGLARAHELFLGEENGGHLADPAAAQRRAQEQGSS
jgi:heme exporter protein A